MALARAAWEHFLCALREGVAELALAGLAPVGGDGLVRRGTPGELQWFADVWR